MAIPGINTDATIVQAATAKPGGQISRDDFMKLLIAQLQNQDPLSPMDNQEFAVQLATFNSLEQLVGINERLQMLSSEQSLAGRISSAEFVGKEVVANSDQVNLGKDGDVALHYELAGNAAKVTIKVLDASGNVVRQVDAGSQKAGKQTRVWNGETDRGEASPAGIYRFEVIAVDNAGNTIPVARHVRGVVTGVDVQASEPLLEIGDLRLPLTSLVSIH
jgi:flagellar basal-body rod modification protein FlgD